MGTGTRPKRDEVGLSGRSSISLLIDAGGPALEPRTV
jgi:hypothetical protein